ncbi:segregation and condensation protein A [Idiomarina xiamenensis]|uniref:Segregation and condensation protein A n=1 Tax=Idiomarina xiamenensis 10-D-4 TaxID=740709 RepID=K2L330_9GAMM|nr:ScpA family protein [Idiomarina xiamenensis]EKE84305.1 hypothetical protein A10D4_06436 [Idiomarina xiamenensis 10-D-4]
MNSEVIGKPQLEQGTVKQAADPHAAQQPLPLGFVRGEPVIERPQDLYIPPHALEVILESFSGPMDLLLYLIRKQKLDILDLPVFDITKQYVSYVEMMHELNLELAADYLVMAAMLAEIKSRLLLPKPAHSDDDDELDPRAELVRRLQEYEAIREGAQHLEQLPQRGRDVFVAHISSDAKAQLKVVPPEVSLQELALAFSDVLRQLDLHAHHQIQRENLSTRARMSAVLERLEQQRYVAFAQLFTRAEGRAGVVVSFLAILELVRESLIELLYVDGQQHLHVTLKSAATVPEDAHEAE